MNKRVLESREDRSRKKKKFNDDMEEYQWLNYILQMYPSQSWEPTDFAGPQDLKPQGDRKEKNRISAKNSRERTKRRNRELEDRLMHLRKEADLQYMIHLPDMDMAAIVAHDMFIKKIDQLHLPDTYLDIPINLEGWDI